MPVIIHGVDPKSVAHKAKILAGETLLSINGHEITDVLDYRFYINERKLKMSITDVKGKTRTVLVKKGEYDDPGLEFKTYLMDRQRSCKNKCIFCFIDQLPPGMRESLYFKDDDSRLSFLFGNYITLTNLTKRDVDRIVQMHISPINVSVHTTNPELRNMMMGNRFAGDSLKYLRQFADAGIRINCQIVACPALNDGKELKRSLDDLSALFPALESIAIVPVGLTKYREGLVSLREFNTEEAAAVVTLIEKFGNECIPRYGRRLAMAADEFYIKAGLPIPDADVYGDFSQLENGVGLMALLKSEFAGALYAAENTIGKRKITIATSVSAYSLLKWVVDEAMKKWHNLEGKVIAIQNHFFGESINVAGLITGKDLIDQLTDKELGDALIIPSVMLKREGDVFLDDVSISELSEVLRVPVTAVPVDGEKLLAAIMGKNL